MTSSASGFIGRELELANVRAGLGDATAGHGHLSLFNGELGIGNNKLADELGLFIVGLPPVEAAATAS